MQFQKKKKDSYKELTRRNIINCTKWRNTILVDFIVKR